MSMSKTGKAYKGVAMEGIIASWYTKNTAKDLKRHKYMAERIAKNLSTGSRVLEVAPGPGYFCIELAKLGHYEITGLDISRSFVAIAQKNADEAGLKMNFRQGDAAHMPFENESFDFVFCQAAFKNFTQPVQAIREMHRVLRPHSSAVIVDLRSDAKIDEIDQEIQGMRLNRVNEILTRWTFQQMLLKSAYGVDQMKEFVSQTPFEHCKINASGIGFEVWLEK
jgi:ubiquinone/menaquinone biosynthesis C-methylase UbiE